MTAVSIIGSILIIIGLWGMLTKKNIVKIIIGFSIIDTGIHLIIVSVGYIRGGTAPILDSTVDRARVVDPLPSALVLTAIVIGLAITALMLVYAVQLHRKRGSLDITAYKELKC